MHSRNNKQTSKVKVISNVVVSTANVKVRDTLTNLAIAKISGRRCLFFVGTSVSALYKDNKPMINNLAKTFLCRTYCQHL